MTLPEPIRWGILGIGRFGRLHARAVQSIYGLELAAICNRNRVRLDEAHAAFPLRARQPIIASCSTTRRSMPSASRHIGKIITKWRRALESGKHVLLEKPMAATSDECRQLVELARTARGKFMVGHICRFDPRVALAKQAIDDGRIGRIVSMHGKRNLPQVAGALRLDKISPLMGDGIHDADLMMWFLSRAPTRVYARHVRFNEFRYPDVGWAMLEFDDAAIGVVETNWGLPANAPTVIDATLQVVGTDGMLTIDCSQTGLTILDSNGLKMQDTIYWPEQHGSLVGVLRNEIGYFADCIGRDRDPEVITPKEAALAVRVMEAAERSGAAAQPVVLT